MDGRANHTPLLWQIAQFSDLTVDAEDIEGKKISPETECSRRELLIEDTRPGISGMDGRAAHTQVLWQIAQFSDLTEDAEDIEEKKSVRTQKSRRELLIEDTRPGLSGVGGIFDKKFEFNEIPA